MWKGRQLILCMKAEGLWQLSENFGCRSLVFEAASQVIGRDLQAVCMTSGPTHDAPGSVETNSRYKYNHALSICGFKSPF